MRNNLKLIRIFILMVGFMVIVGGIVNEMGVVRSETLPTKGPVDISPQEGSCFWGGRRVNGLFYFYIYQGEAWHFSSDMKEAYLCPIKIWSELDQEAVSDIWYKGYKGTLEDKENVMMWGKYIINDQFFIVREKFCRCYDNLFQIKEGIIKEVAEGTVDIGEIFGLEKEYLTGEGVEYYNITYYETTSIFEKLEEGKKGIGITFVEEDAFLSIRGNLFTNIIPYEEGKDPNYIFLDEQGEIIRADFTVNDKGGSYTFGNNAKFVPPNSRVFFDKRATGIPEYTTAFGIDIKVPDGSDLTEFSGLFDYVKEGYPTILRGDEITLPNNIILRSDDLSKNGELIIEENGYLFREGIIDYKDKRFDSSKQLGDILFADSDADLSDYEGNWVRESSKDFEMHSVEEGRIKMEALPGNEFFEIHEEDYLRLEIHWGDGLKVIKDKGEIFTIEHYPSKRGKIVIRNGMNDLKLEDGAVWYEHYLIEERKLGMEQSVPFQVKSSVFPKTNSGENYLLEFDGENSFWFLSPNGEKRLFFRYGL